MIPVLRRSLIAPLSNGGPSAAFVLPCKKLVVEYCETWGSNRGMQQFIQSSLVPLACANPSVELVLRRVENRLFLRLM